MLTSDDINRIRTIFLHPESRVTVAETTHGRRKEGIRRLTVSTLLRQRSSARSGHDRVPFLRVSGRWLEQCGFVIGARYYLTVEQGKLMLTLAEPDGSDEPMAD
jgi:Toxin SymE, type I toxin-antitoxin system